MSDVAANVLADTLRTVAIDRDHAVDALDKLEAMVTAIGGHLDPVQQETLARARTVLVATGRRPPLIAQTWVDRVCICERVKLADGTNATAGRIVNAACVLHGQRL